MANLSYSWLSDKPEIYAGQGYNKKGGWGVPRAAPPHVEHPKSPYFVKTLFIGILPLVKIEYMCYK
jgi:hypothetical protein